MIKLTITKSNGILSIHLYNDGPLLSSTPTEGIGLNNIQKRLEKLYGSNFKFELENDKSGNGVNSILEILWAIKPMIESNTIKVIIADDEPAARKVIAHFLTEHAGFELIDECADGQTALSMILENKPDLVFLDIQMPELSGIEIIAQLEAPMPIIVFVTAYDNMR